MNRNQNLAAKYAPRRAEQLLQFWANLADPGTPDFKGEVDGLVAGFPEVFGELRQGQEDFLRSVWGLRENLRKVWAATDLREREWYIYELRRLHSQHVQALSSAKIADALKREAEKLLPPGKKLDSATFPSVNGVAQQGRLWGFWTNPPPELTAFERVMFHFQQIAHGARRCENKECFAPFFLRKKKGQIFCSPECALPAQKKAKSDWWARNRKKQNTKRRERRRKGKSTRKPGGSQ